MKTQRGMTLVEVLVATSISSLVILVVGGLYFAARHMDRRTQTARDLGEISLAMESVTAELRQASRDPGAVVVWDADTGDVRRKVVGVLSTRVRAGGLSAGQVGPGPRWTGWIYFVHDPVRHELRRIERPGVVATAPPVDGGEVLARNVLSFDVTNHNELYTVTLVARKDGQTLRLQTEVWPRNE